MGICGTWLSDFNELMYIPAGFQCVPLTRQDKSGGGVALFVPTAMEYEQRTDLSSVFIKDISAECIAIDLLLRTNHSVSSRNRNLVICKIYRPPGGLTHLFLESMEWLLEKSSSEGPIVSIMGDLNISLMDCPISPISTDLLNLFQPTCFVPLINRPTRVTYSNYSLIDILFPNDISRISGWKTMILTCSVSDYFLISHSMDLFTTTNRSTYADLQKGYLINQNNTLAKLSDSFSGQD